MDGTRFDAWTRRRFGLATGGVVASLVTLTLRDDTEASKKRRTCRKVNQSCAPGKKKKKKSRRCCQGLTCDEGKSASGLVCCRDVQAGCDADSECCRALRCRPAHQLSGRRCCSAFGEPCRVDRDCCGDIEVFCNAVNECDQFMI